jgi:hypothetical protein
MRAVLVLVATALLLAESGGRVRTARATSIISPVAVAKSPAPPAHIDFETQLKPIFKSRCMPCHFSGGQMYDRLPFDRPETIRKLGTRLFTRIKEENERHLIEDFLAQAP